MRKSEKKDPTTQSNDLKSGTTSNSPGAVAPKSPSSVLNVEMHKTRMLPAKEEKSQELETPTTGPYQGYVLTSPNRVSFDLWN